MIIKKISPKMSEQMPKCGPKNKIVFLKQTNKINKNSHVVNI